MSDQEPRDATPEDFLPKLTDMAAAAIGLHELFTSYVDAGFTRGEALQMVMCILTAAAQNRDS